MKLIGAIFLALLIPLVGTIITDAPVVWPISVVIYNLGLLYSFTLVPQKILKMILYNIIATILFVVESSFFFSYYLQNTGFNEAFFYHIRPDLIHAGLKEYSPILIGMFTCLFGFLAMSTFTLANEKLRKGWMLRWTLPLLALGIFISPPAKALVMYGKNLTLITNRNDVFENFPELKGTKVTVQFSKSKRPNIVLVYAESLEQRFFDETIFPDLLPNLKRLRERSIDFSNVAQGVGAGWTIGGIVASQCGYPLTASHDVGPNGLSIFDRFLPGATCLGDLLRKDGYRLTFIGGADVRFAGKGNFLKSHGYKEVLDLDDLAGSLADKSYFHGWGIYDDTLFDYATDKFLTMSREGAPFLLTLLTLDSHNGFMSDSCKIYGSGDNTYLNSIHCSDQLIPRFIEQIRSSPFSENTIIIVLSDHLALSQKASSLLEASQMPRRLTFFVNTPNGKKEENINPGLHYDIAPTIMDFVGYKIRGQVGFGAPLTRGPGYLPSRFGEDEWEKQSANLIAIGNTLWDNDVTLDQNGINLDDSIFSLAMGGREFNLRSWGATDVPASTLFIFDAKSLKLEKIKTYAFDKGLTVETLSKELLEHREKLVLVISRIKYLPRFSEPRFNPNQWAFFFGKPGSNSFSWGPITGDIIISFDLIRKLSQSKMDDIIIPEREKVLKSIPGNKTAMQGK